MSRSHRILLLPALLLALMISACADPETAPSAGGPGALPETGLSPGQDPGSGDAGEPEPPTTSPERRDTPPPESPERRDARPVPEGCPEPIVEAARATIGAQLAAFARGDFSAALAEASPGFQAGIDPETFQGLIERDYALLLEDASAEVEGCAQLRPDLSDVVAVIATADGTRTRFAYRLRLADDRWGIDAAVRLDPPPATA